MISVIIPTRNRASCLKDAVKSVLEQTLDRTDYEILVIDNGSTDRTDQVVEELNGGLDFIRYLYASEPGLHVGRHMGAKNAKGDILVFTDDDIIASPQWLDSIRKAFEDEKTVLVGGKILPKWEGEVPEWIDRFRTVLSTGWTIGYLSLLDLGDNSSEVSPCYVYGCNYSIRKSILWECGGFHPDGMPKDLIQFRGDGETALSKEIERKGYKTVYEPEAVVYHRVPQERLTEEYFCRRAFNQGVSDSFSEIRQNGGIRDSLKNNKHISMLRWLIRFVSMEHAAKKKVRESYMAGKEFHRSSVESDMELLKYVLRERYY